MALFGQKQTSLDQSYYFPTYGSCVNQAGFLASNMSSYHHYGTANRKRPLDLNLLEDLDAPPEKKFEQISDDLKKFSINSPQISEVIDEEVIDEDLPTGSNDEVLVDREEAEQEFFVDEPEEGGQLVLSDDLLNYINRMKREKLVPTLSPNNALILYNPADSIRSRIVEVIGEGDQTTSENNCDNQPIVEPNTPSPIISSPEMSNDDEVISNDEWEKMEID